MEHRSENIRRIGEVSKLLVEAGVIVLTAFISPSRQDRERTRNLFLHNDFIEIFCDAPLGVCEQRDVKGLYARARAGEVKEFTGISSPYETPMNPDLSINTGSLPVDECVEQVLAVLRVRGIIPK